MEYRDIRSKSSRSVQMWRGPLHRLWDVGKECGDGAGRAHILQAHTACQLLYVLASTLLVQVRSPGASFGDPSNSQYSWPGPLEHNATAKRLLIFPAPSKTVSAKNRPIVCFFSLAAVGKPFLPLTERRVA